MHFLGADTACAVAGYVSLMALDSCLALSCARFENEELAKQLAEEYTSATWYNHSPADIVEFFDGLELVGPGVTEARTWPKRPPSMNKTDKMRSGGLDLMAGQAERPRLITGYR